MISDIIIAMALGGFFGTQTGDLIGVFVNVRRSGQADVFNAVFRTATTFLAVVALVAYYR